MDGSVATQDSGHNGRRLTQRLPVIVILGATATGKSALALEIAGRFDGEVISADSRYLYRGMDVGTAKPTEAELQRVPHHLVNIIEPEDDYSLATWLEEAFAAIEDVGKRGRLPVVAGGTPLYLRALLEGWVVPAVPPEPALRERLERLETATIYTMVARIDPVSAERIGPSNKRRLIRAYEVFERTGLPLSSLEGRSAPPYRTLILGLRQERQPLYERIDARVEWMYENGILEEALALVERGLPDSAPAMSAIGYRDAAAVLTGELTFDEAIERTCLATHRYVRHQETWFRRFEGVTWLDSSQPGFSEQAMQLVDLFLANQARATG